MLRKRKYPNKYNYSEKKRLLIIIIYNIFRTIADHCDQVEEHASVKQLKLNSEKGTSITLEQCFDVSCTFISF